jgi:hypothetical protein
MIGPESHLPEGARESADVAQPGVQDQGIEVRSRARRRLHIEPLPMAWARPPQTVIWREDVLAATTTQIDIATLPAMQRRGR